MKTNYSQFIAECPVKTARGAKLSRFCTMKVGGPADLFVEAKTKGELVEILRLAKKLSIKFYVIAGGSNVVFPDRGFRGLVIRYIANQIKVAPRLRSGSSATATVEAGAKLGYFVKYLIDKGFGGFNFLANIPGSVGGAIVGNAGCYGKEISEFLKSVEFFNTRTMELATVKPSELGFGYRHSKLKDKPELIVLGATFKLAKIDKKQALKEIAEEKQLRCNKHPQGPSCGSWFKNPERGIPAWKFIDDVGLRGHTIGGAKISRKHSNFLVNCGRAKSKDICKLSELVQQKVKAKTGTSLEPEVRMIDY